MHQFSFTLDYNTCISVNAKYSSRNFSKSKAYKEYQEHVQWQILRTGKYQTFDPEKKVYIAGMVYRPDYRSDIDNFIKGIFDAISSMIGVNDNRFAIKYWDYEICKENPRIEITVSQT